MTAPTQQAPDVTAGQLATYALEAAVTAKAIQMAIRAALMRDVVKLWPALDKSRLAETFPGWLRAMSLLITNYRDQSSFAAGRSYQAMRAQALQSPTPASLIKMAPAPEQEWLSRALGFSGPGMLDKETAQPGTALSTTLGTAARIVLDGGLTTMTDTVRTDPAAVGYFRVTDGDPCAFCALLASRGIVYKRESFRASDKRFTGSGADKVHNLCGCTLAPAFNRKQGLPSISSVAGDVYEQSPEVARADGKNKLAAFRKAWADRESRTAGAPTRPAAAPKKAAPPSKPGRTADQIRAELSSLEERLSTASVTQRDWLTKRINALRAQLEERR